MGRRGQDERVGQCPLPSPSVKLSFTYMECIGSQFIQKAVDHVDPHTQLLPAQAHDKALIDAH